MSDDLIAVLLRDLLADEQAMRELRRALGPQAAEPTVPAYTVATLASAIGLSEKAIRNALVHGDLHGRKRSGRWLITKEDVQAWLGPPDEPDPARRRPSPRRRPLGSAFDGLEGWR